MRHFLISTVAIGVLGFATAGAMAQTPVPNASGSQVTSPETYGATAYQNRAMKPQPKMPWPTMKQRQVTKKRSVETTGSIGTHSRAKSR